MGAWLGRLAPQRSAITQRRRMSPWSLRPLLEMDESTCPYLYDVVGQVGWLAMALQVGMTYGVFLLPFEVTYLVLYNTVPSSSVRSARATSTNVHQHRRPSWGSVDAWMDGWMADGWGQMPPNFGAIVPASASKPAGPQTIGLGGALRSSRPATGANLALETLQFGWCRWDAAQRLHALMVLFFCVLLAAARGKEGACLLWRLCNVYGERRFEEETPSSFETLLVRGSALSSIRACTCCLAVTD